MKKGIIVLLITVLAAGMAFASVSGSASFSAGFDLDDKVFTVDNSKTGKNAFKFDLAAESGETAAVESGIYAKMGASLEASIKDGSMKVDFKLTDATIQSVDGLWSVNLTAVDNGVELTYDDNALDVYFVNKLNWGASLTSKEFTIVDGLTVSANVGYAVAKNDLGNVADYSYDVDSKITKAIAKAKNTKEYFALNDDGTYQNAELLALQEDVAKKEAALAAAEAKFAADPSEENYAAIDEAQGDLDEANDALSDKVAELEETFMAKNAGDEGGKWYSSKTTYSYAEKWQVKASAPASYIAGATGDLEKGVQYYIVLSSSSPSSYSAVKASEFTPEAGKEVVATLTPSAAGKAYLVGTNTPKTTYAIKDEHYKFQTPDKGTATVNGGLTIAYSADKISASVEANVAYETISEDLSYDVAVKGGYDFVNVGAAFDSDKVLDADLSVKLDSIVNLPLSFSFGATDILAKDEGRVFTAGASVEVSGFTFSANGAYDTTPAKGVGKISATVKAGYKMDIATISLTAGISQEAAIGEDHNYGEAKLAVAPTLEITNTTLINNATLGLKWAGAHFGGDEAKKSLGAVTATIGVKF